MSDPQLNKEERPKPGEIRTINGDRCRFIEEDDKGYVWEVLNPAARQSTEGKVFVPAGWKLVPIEMTEAMHTAGIEKVMLCAMTPGRPWLPSVYTAALAAAPTPPEEGKEGALAPKAIERLRKLAAERGRKSKGGDPDYLYGQESQDLRAVLDALAAPSPAPSAVEMAGVDRGLPMDLAARDGTMVWLLMDFTGDHNAWMPLADARRCWTIGFNNFDNDEIDAWKFAGWSWSHDCFIEGVSPEMGMKVVGWKPIGFELEADDEHPSPPEKPQTGGDA